MAWRPSTRAYTEMAFERVLNAIDGYQDLVRQIHNLIDCGDGNSGIIDAVARLVNENAVLHEKVGSYGRLVGTIRRLVECGEGNSGIIDAVVRLVDENVELQEKVFDLMVKEAQDDD